MNEEFCDKTYRDAFVEANIRNGIAFQIRALRKKNDWSQGKLGEKSGKAQNVISRLEDPEYGKFTIQTLLSLASAFDVALAVRFVSYADFIGHLQNVSDEALGVPSFEEEVNDRLQRTSAAIAKLSEPKFSNAIPADETLAINRQPAVGALAAMTPTFNFQKATRNETALS